MTSMYFDVLVSTELLNRSYYEFMKLSEDDRNISRLFYKMKMDREEYFNKKQLEEMKNQQNQLKAKA